MFVDIQIMLIRLHLILAGQASDEVEVDKANDKGLRGKMEAKQDYLLRCPKCNSEYVHRIHRPRVIKMITQKKRYVCSGCGRRFYSAIPPK